MRTPLLRTTLTGLLLLIPLTVVALSQIDAEDSIAGLGLEIKVQGLPASSAVDIVVTPPARSAVTIPVRTDAKGNADVHMEHALTEQAGTYRVEVQQKGMTIASGIEVTVLPDALDPATSEIQSWNPSIAADGEDRAEITVTLRDQYGNVLAGRPVTVISSRPEDRITADTPQTNDDGIQYFSLTTEEPGAIRLRAIDLLSGNTIDDVSDITAGSNMGIGGTGTPVRKNGQRMFYAQVGSFDVIDGFEITVPATLPVDEEAPKITIRAVDRDGAIVEDYVGTVIFSSTDPEATLPNFGSYTFKERDLGQKQFPLILKFSTEGEQVFRVEDKNDSSIFAEESIFVEGEGHNAASGRGIQITSHKDGDAVNTTDILIEGKGPKLANLRIMGGAADATGATDDSGNFSVPVSLNPSKRDFTIRVQDDTGRNDSGPVNLTLDQTSPSIGTITFAPERPEAGQKVLIVVQSEPGLPQMILRLADAASGEIQEIPLAENSTSSGSYQAFFTAPAANVYQPAIAAMDRAGNVTEVRATFTVGSQSLPTVQNVRAEPRVNAVALEWDALSPDLSGYRIYVGDAPENFLYTLDTGRVTTKATVAGLTPGKTYYFAVTALKDELESGEKSTPAPAQVLGLTLEITPEDSALQVNWGSLSTELPLASFLLEYGVAPDQLTETRILNGDLRDYAMRDLLNGVTYYVTLTPVTVTQDKLEELAATGNGTPNGTGFRTSIRDDIPFDALKHPGNLLTPPPMTSGTGLPSVVWMSAAATGIAGVWLQLRRRRSIRSSSAFLQAIQSQYHR